MTMFGKRMFDVRIAGGLLALGVVAQAGFGQAAPGGAASGRAGAGQAGTEQASPQTPEAVLAKLLEMKGGRGSMAAGQATAAAPGTRMTRSEINEMRDRAEPEVIFLKHSSQANDGNEILTGLRLMLDAGIKIYLVPSQNAIWIKGLPSEMATARRIVAAMDVARRNYKLVYTVTELDGSKKVSTQRFVLEGEDGQRATMRGGAKLPIVTGKADDATGKTMSVMTYADVGWNIDATVVDMEGGGTLKSKVERSSVDATVGLGGDPVLHQTIVEGIIELKTGKREVLGEIVMPENGHMVQVEVELEAGG